MPRVPIDVVLDYRLDGLAKSVHAQQAGDILARPGQARPHLVIDGVSEKSSEVADAMDDGRLRTASLTIDDSGLLAKLLPPLAQEQGQTAEGLVGVALVSLAAFCEGQGPATLKALDAHGLLRRRLEGAEGDADDQPRAGQDRGPVGYRQVMEPNALVDIFGLSTSYPATREGAAKAGPTAK